MKEAIQEPKLTQVRSIKYIDSRGIDTFEGVVTAEGLDRPYARGSQPYRWERVGIDAFLTESEAVHAGVRKLERAIINIENKKQKLILELKRLQNTSIPIGMTLIFFPAKRWSSENPGGRHE